MLHVIVILSLIIEISCNIHICPSGSVFVDRFAKCYSFLKTPTDWASAEQQCRTLFPDGHLLSIANAFENSFITGEASKQFCSENTAWIGGNNLANPNNQSSYVWSDNRTFSYTRWASGFPTTDSSSNCVASYISRFGQLFNLNTQSNWINADCFASKPAICESLPIDPPTPAPIVRPACQSEWTYYESTQSCYIVRHGADSFESAESRCNALGSHLVSIHSENENKFVFILASMHTKSIGESVPNHSWLTFIGLHNPSHSRWIWTDESSTTYLNWAKSESNGASKNEWCAQIYTDPIENSEEKVEHYIYKWNDIPCIGKMRAFVCKSPIQK